MFKPLRFNNLLKAVPGLSHLQLTPQAAHNTQGHKTQTHEHIETENIHAANGAVRRTRVVVPGTTASRSNTGFTSAAPAIPPRTAQAATA